MTGADNPLTLMQLWRAHRAECRAIGSIVSDAREGKLPGVELLPSGFGFSVINPQAAIAAMKAGGDNFKRI